MNNYTGVQQEQKYAWSIAFECGVTTHLNYTLRAILGRVLTCYEANELIWQSNFEIDGGEFVVIIVKDDGNIEDDDEDREASLDASGHEPEMHIFPATADGLIEFLRSYHCDPENSLDFFFDIVEMPSTSLQEEVTA